MKKTSVIAGKVRADYCIAQNRWKYRVFIDFVPAEEALCLKHKGKSHSIKQQPFMKKREKHFDLLHKQNDLNEKKTTRTLIKAAEGGIEEISPLTFKCLYLALLSSIA